MTPPILDVTDVRKSHGRIAALNGVTFSVAAGELFGLLGPNGAGKTTLISILSGLAKADAGGVRLDGEPFDLRRADQRRLVGLAPQDLAVYADLTARENLDVFGELYGLRGTALRSRVDEVLAAVALTDRAGQRVGTFSGGMKRRLNLAAAVVHRPRLVFLDEPTTGVDPQSRNHIFESVRRLNAEGLTVVYTSHYMEEVEALCKRIAVMDHGRVVACDTLPGLLRLLDGRVRVRLAAVPPDLPDRLRELPGVRCEVAGGHVVDVACRDVGRTLLALGGLLAERKADVLELETTEPGLERVFLHLTGWEVRD
jgi:ABC-2 type transport system ATP-binding protein